MYELFDPWLKWEKNQNAVQLPPVTQILPLADFGSFERLPWAYENFHIFPTLAQLLEINVKNKIEADDIRFSLKTTKLQRLEIIYFFSKINFFDFSETVLSENIEIFSRNTVIELSFDKNYLNCNFIIRSVKNRTREPNSKI